ncbi:MAG: DUF1285 domain-containing protein [Proteobacteria bacterium]|nr:DUF1285 domain-containing protein [Pseudomonadota bacterium]
MTEVGPKLAGAAQRLMAGAMAVRGPAPVHLWNPAYCGEIDMRIAADGRWFYNGSPINRMAMVKLFATILRKDPERFVLVTPVERVGIIVDDAPFLAVDLASEADPAGERLFVRTNLDEVVEISEKHPMRFETDTTGGLKPYILIRGDLWALATRALTHDLIARCREENGWFGLKSGTSFFAVAPAEAVAGQI